jgi:hypothetical protein
MVAHFLCLLSKTGVTTKKERREKRAGHSHRFLRSLDAPKRSSRPANSFALAYSFTRFAK